jgi:acetoin utilization deacetylase AcuC-like enzyme
VEVSSPPLVVGDDPLFDSHRALGPHPERPERLVAARAALEGVTHERAASRDASDGELALAHAPALVETLARFEGQLGMLDADTFVAPSSVAAARRASGVGLAVVEQTRARPSGRGLALLRPPGHHATRDRAMGFCLFNHVAVAAAAALHTGEPRVAIVDFDVHHGNGTQDVFYRDGRVLFVSLHQFPFYPGTGAVDEVGEGEGRGATVNVPLSEGAGDAAYALAFESVVLPALARFEPTLLLVSAGFDGHARDPLAHMQLTERGYAHMVGELSRFAGERPLALFLEGGYDLPALEASLAASLRALGPSAPPSEPSPPLPFGPVAPQHAHELRLARARHGL